MGFTSGSAQAVIPLLPLTSTASTGVIKHGGSTSQGKEPVSTLEGYTVRHYGS